MIRLHQTFGAHAGRVVELDREVIRFGRLPDNEFAFDPHADLDASGRHAEIRREGGQWVLVDVGSRNGTLIQGRRVTRHVLTTGEEVEFGLGGPRVRVELAPPIRPGAPTAEATPVHRGPVETAAATPVAIKGNSSLPPPHAMHPTPPPSPFAGPHEMPAVVAPPGMAPYLPPPAPLPQFGGPHVSPAPHLSPPPANGEKKYGQRTVGMMIQAALAEAERQQQQNGGNRSTAFFRAIADEAARNNSRGLKIAVAFIALLVVLTLGAVVALFFYARWQEEQLRHENVRLQRQLAQLGDGAAADSAENEEERRRIEERIQALNDRIQAQQETAGARIVAQNEGAVYLLASERDARRDVVCTAFAVRADLLATNAHCVGELERAMDRGYAVSVLSNRGRASPMRVRQMWRHPAYVADSPMPSPDVGLIRVDGTLPQTVRMASMADLTNLRAGDDVFVYGFPSQIAPTGSAVAGLTTGIVGRATAFDGTEVDAARRHLISHSAISDDGTAGSPLFDREGRVVAINAGNYRARSRVVDTGTRIARTVESETPYAWAVRADLLLQLVAGLPAQSP